MHKSLSIRNSGTWGTSPSTVEGTSSDLLDIHSKKMALMSDGYREAEKHGVNAARSFMYVLMNYLAKDYTSEEWAQVLRTTICECQKMGSLPKHFIKLEASV